MLFLVFQLNDDRYALDVSQVVEVLPLVRIRKMLRSPPGIAGTINYRGAHVPVVDLSELALGRPAALRLSTRIILANCSEQEGKSQRSGESSIVGSADKALDDTCKFRLVAIKAGNHGIQHFMRLELVEIDRVAGIVSQQGEESQLRTAVAFAESVDNV